MSVTTGDVFGVEAAMGYLMRTSFRARFQGSAARLMSSRFAQSATGALIKRQSAGACLHTLNATLKTYIQAGAGRN